MRACYELKSLVKVTIWSVAIMSSELTRRSVEVRTFRRSVVGIDGFLEISLGWFSCEIGVCVDPGDVYRAAATALVIFPQYEAGGAGAVRSRVL